MTNPEFNLRRARVDEVDRLVTLINRAFEVELQFFTSDRIDVAAALKHFQKGTFIVAEDGEDFVGCNYVELRGDSGYFGLLSVAPEHQGRGLGRQLIDAAEKFCFEAGCSIMRIRVLNHRTELPPFYEKLGYRVAGTEEVEQEPAARMPYNFIVMEKVLEAGGT